MGTVTIYSAFWCPDCRRVKAFLRERGIEFCEIDIESDPEAEEIVIKANNGKRKVPTLEIAGRYVSCSPFDAAELAAELNISPNR